MSNEQGQTTAQRGDSLVGSDGGFGEFGEKRYAAVKRRIERERDEYQSSRLLSEQALDLCHAIEKSGFACEQLTKCSLLASQLRQELEIYEQVRPLTWGEKQKINDAWQKHVRSSPNK